MKEKTEAIKLLKPANLNLEKIIVENIKYLMHKRKNNGEVYITAVSHKIVRKYIPVLYYFIHKLIIRQHSGNEKFQYKADSKDLDDIEANETFYHRMYARDIEVLKTKNDFVSVMSLLRNLNIVEVVTDTETTKYKNSSLAYFFKLKTPYSDSPLEVAEIDVPASKVQRINQTLGERTKQSGGEEEPLVLTDSVLKQQYQSILNLNFNIIEASKHISDSYRRSEIKSSNYNSCFIAINQLANERITFSVSNNCDRIYTNVTSMPKVIRQFILDNNGNSLVELDFGAFNAFALYRFLIKKINTDEIALQEEELSHFTGELVEYKKLLLSEDFYSELMKHPLVNTTDRDKLKRNFLKNWLNAKVDNNSKFRKSIESVFPMISKVITAYKVKDYKTYSNTFMKMESELVNYKIYSKIIEKYPDTTIYTIFDCVLIEFKYSKILYKMMIDEGAKFFGVEPRVKVKCLDPRHQKLIDKITGSNLGNEDLTGEQKEALLWQQYYDRMNLENCQFK